MSELIWKRAIEAAGLGDIYEKVLKSERLSFEDGMRLYAAPQSQCARLSRQHRARAQERQRRLLGAQPAHQLHQRLQQGLPVLFVLRASPKTIARAYVMTPEQAPPKVANYGDVPITEIHVVGGVNPKLPYTYYLELLRAIKAARPAAHIKAFTMVEIDQIVRAAKKPAEEVFEDLKAAGLDALPGGGAEVMSDRVHEDLFHTKPNADALAGTRRNRPPRRPQKQRHPAVRPRRADAGKSGALPQAARAAG